jgi:hypothetical protein
MYLDLLARDAASDLAASTIEERSRKLPGRMVEVVTCSKWASVR